MSIVAAGLFSLVLGLSTALPTDAPEVQAGLTCTECSREMKADWNFCPYDGVPLRRACPKCKKVWGKNWKFCPDDGSALTTGKGKEAGPKGPVDTSANTPDQVLEDFLDALKMKNAKLLDGLIHWESYYRSYLADQKIEEKALSPEAFRKKVHGEFLNDAIQERVKSMVKRFQDGNSYNINGDSARFRITLVNPRDQEQRMANTFDLRKIDGRWLITFIT